MTQFSQVYKGKHGDTVESDNPKLDAYKQAAYIQNTLGRNYSITSHANGEYAVQGDGCAAIAFAPATVSESGQAALLAMLIACIGVLTVCYVFAPIVRDMLAGLPF